MNSVLFSVAAFVVALGILITIHEFGHFWVARKLGVKVLRFSIGFGRPLYRKVMGRDKTELVIAALPLGGYVKMLDEREGDVPEKELERAFNRKPLATRTAVVAAGPIANFLFAIFAYWLMFVAGVPGLRPVLGEVAPGTFAHEAGLQAGDEILRLDGEEIGTWDEAMVGLLDGALAKRQVAIGIRTKADEMVSVWLDLRGSEHLLDDGNLLHTLGLTPWRPLLPAHIESVEPEGAAYVAGIQAGDRVLSADGVELGDWGAWVDYVRQRPDELIFVEVDRDGSRVQLSLRPLAVSGDDGTVGRIGARVSVPENFGQENRVVVRHGPLAALDKAVAKTWDMSSLTLRTLWTMLWGEASVKNISGPISIAHYAGQSASLGLSSFLGFLALVSVSLGVLNLLPVPVLDGGHLMYYLIEFFKGGPVSEQVQLWGQQIGIAVLLSLMGLAFYNDLVRLIG